MLFRVEIENFYSIRDMQIVDLVAAENAVSDPDRLSALWQGSKARSPKTVAVFGANASGKSTVLKAVSFLAWWIAHSFSAPANQRIMFDKFNEQESFVRPSRLAIELGGITDISQLGNPDAPQGRYRYELVVSGSSTEEPAHVSEETVYYWPAPHEKKTLLFRRNDNTITKYSKEFGLGGFRQALDKILRPNASVISTLFQLKHPFATAMWNSASMVFSNIFIETTDTDDDAMTRHYASNGDHLQHLNRDISRIDVGVQQVQLQSGQNGPYLQFIHDALAVPMPMYLESKGTRSFLKLYPIIAQALSSGGIAIVDELDASIHPMILPEIFGWFHDRARNPNDAQLWVTCHNASLLDFLSKEEILFCEKDALGRTTVYALTDIAGVRREDNFYKKYLGGVYGALPVIG